MKLIILEGGDRLGKSTLIEGLSKHFNYDNVHIRHFGKPPKVFPEGVNPLNFQMECFKKEGVLLQHLKQMEDDDYCYYENIVMWNRAHLGELVYGQMFRGLDPSKIKNALLNFEEQFLLYYDINVYLITLTADPKFFHSMEDGNSFSKKLDDKTKELELFKEAHEFSTIQNKLLVKVDHQFTSYKIPSDWHLSKKYDKVGTTSIVTEFRSKEDILKEVLNFIK